MRPFTTITIASFFAKMGTHNVLPNYKIERCCQLLYTCSPMVDCNEALGFSSIKKKKLSLVNSLNFWHFKQIIFKKFDNSKNNLIFAKPEKLLMVAIYRQGFCTLLAHSFLSFFLEESVEGLLTC